MRVFVGGTKMTEGKGDRGFESVKGRGDHDSKG